jgi:hypothetical protein
MAEKDAKGQAIGEHDPVVAGPAGAIPVDQLVTVPTGPPFVGPDAGPETKEAREMREARGDPEPKPLWGKGAEGAANKPFDNKPERASHHASEPRQSQSTPARR